MENLETSKTPVDANLMSKMDHEQDPCAETLDTASGVLISSDKCTVLMSASGVSSGKGGDVADNNLKNEVINNVENENHVVDNREFRDVEGKILIGGENCWDFGGTEAASLVNEAVADENEEKECVLGLDSGGDIVAMQCSYENVNEYELAQEVCSTDIQIEEVGADTWVIQQVIEEVGAEKIIMEKVIEEVEAEKVLMEKVIEEVEAEKVIEEVEAEKVLMEKVIEEVEAEKVVMQEGFEEVKAEEKVVVWEGNEEIGAEMVPMQEDVEERDVSKQNVVDFGNKVDVSEKGISLYVDVFGPVENLVQDDDSCLVEDKLLSGNLNEKDLPEGNYAVLPDDEYKGNVAQVEDCCMYKDAEGTDVGEKAIADGGYRFNVGELAWAKIKTQLWWPGVICETETAKTDQDNFQVRIFESGNVLWGRPSQLKPFLEDFEQMSRQSNSRSFHYAVEKAVCEIGRRVKLEMTCPCYAEDVCLAGVAEGRSIISKEKACKLDEFPVLQFEPENLLARMKCFARDVTLAGTIEIKVIQNRLNAYYRSIGHHQLPVDQLKPNTDGKSDEQNVLTSGVISSKQASKSKNRSRNKGPRDGNDETIHTVIPAEMKTPSPILSSKSSKKKVNSVEQLDCRTDGIPQKSYESRQRKKSKYLSFPFVDPSQATESSIMEDDDITDPSKDNSMGSVRTAKSCDKKTSKNGCRKRSSCDMSDSDAINASSAEMLSTLRFTALGCPDESKHYKFVQSFVSRFRRFAFRNFTHEVSNKDIDMVDFEHDVDLAETLSESPPDISKTAGIGLMNKDRNIKSMPKSSKKDNTTTLGLNTKPNDGFPGNITASGSIVIDFQTKDHGASESESVPIKRKRKTNKMPGSPEIKVMTGQTDLKGACNGAQSEAINVASTNKRKSEPKSKKKAISANHASTNGADFSDENGSNGKVVGSGLREVEVMGPCSLQSIPGLNKEVIEEAAALHLNAELSTMQPDVSKNTEPSLVMKDIQLKNVISSSDKPELKKRKRSLKAGNVTSPIPDLNGSSSESRLQDSHLSGMECIPPEVEPHKKSRKKKSDAGLFDINLSCSEAQANGEALGTALLLKFAPESLMPTKDELTSTFCIFGALKDSDTKIFNNSSAAQVVFVNSSDARTAFCSLEKNSPFGPALVNYRLQNLSAASEILGPDGSLKVHQVWPADKAKNPPKLRAPKKPKNPVNPFISVPGPRGEGIEAPGLQFVKKNCKPSVISSPGSQGEGTETPGLQFAKRNLKPSVISVPSPQGEGPEAPGLQYVKQDLQRMTSMLENAGDNISPEMRAKLEAEIKSLLNKVTSMVGSSSS